jgi:hypothetical protein
MNQSDEKISPSLGHNARASKFGLRPAANIDAAAVRFIPQACPLDHRDARFG